MYTFIPILFVIHNLNRWWYVNLPFTSPFLRIPFYERTIKPRSSRLLRKINRIYNVNIMQYIIRKHLPLKNYNSCIIKLCTRFNGSWYWKSSGTGSNRWKELTVVMQIKSHQYGFYLIVSRREITKKNTLTRTMLLYIYIK